MSTSGKVCTRCGTDCSKKPRTRGPAGYLCVDCLTPEERQTLRPQGAPAAAAPTASPQRSPAPSRAAAPPVADEGVFDLADGAPIEVASGSACPACGGMIAPGGVICLRCGYDQRVGFQRGTGVGASKTEGGVVSCSKCGYSLKGLRSSRCPECGTVNKAPSRRDEMKRDSNRIAVMTYVAPLMITAAGLGVGAAALSTSGGPEALVPFFVTYAVSVPIAILAYFLIGMMWMGFDAPMHLSALRLAAVYAAADGAFYLVSATGFVPLAFLARLIVFWGLLIHLLELEVADAVWIGIAIFGIRIAVSFAIIAMLLGAN